MRVDLLNVSTKFSLQVTHLEAEMTKLSSDQFASCRLNLNRLFEECVTNLECRDRPIRVVYSLQTLCGLIKAVFRKQVCNPIELFSNFKGR